LYGERSDRGFVTREFGHVRGLAKHARKSASVSEMYSPPPVWWNGLLAKPAGIWSALEEGEVIRCFDGIAATHKCWGFPDWPWSWWMRFSLPGPHARGF
jgi:hypothetical protein